MQAGGIQLKCLLFIFIVFLRVLHSRSQLAELQVCERCSGKVLNSSAVGQFCFSSAGRINGRCCVSNGNASDPERITGLDLSNCSLTKVEDLQEASTAVILDLSDNLIVSLSDSTFEGFVELNHLILPPDVACPGGSTSWDRMESKNISRLCEGQKNACNQTGQLSNTCPEFSLCEPNGPGLFSCGCDAGHYGYKCLRKGEFPTVQVFAPLGASTVMVSFLLWVSQRRKVKSA
ncbi:all-trans retinoic acid-induced differentiation factor [Neosynchiropus ocellatus]